MTFASPKSPVSGSPDGVTARKIFAARKIFHTIAYTTGRSKPRSPNVRDVLVERPTSWRLEHVHCEHHAEATNAAYKAIQSSSHPFLHAVGGTSRTQTIGGSGVAAGRVLECNGLSGVADNFPARAARRRSPLRWTKLRAPSSRDPVASHTIGIYSIMKVMRIRRWRDPRNLFRQTFALIGIEDCKAKRLRIVWASSPVSTAHFWSVGTKRSA